MKKIIIDSFLNLLFPPICFGCDKRLKKDEILCKECQSKLIYYQNDKIYLKDNVYFTDYISVFSYNSIVQNLIHNFKYNGFKKIGKFLGKEMAKKIMQSKFLPQINLIISVPLHRIKMRERGFNQSDILGKSVAQNVHLPYKKNIIVRTRYTETQTKLDIKARQKNVENAFIVKNIGLLKNKSVLIIDDVFTTGSTINEISKVILSAGGKRVYALTSAHA